MKEIIAELVRNLEELGEEHEELYDTEVRMRIGKALDEGYADSQEITEYKVPNDLGMLSESSNKRLQAILQKFVQKAIARAKELGLNDPSSRRNAIKDDDLEEFIGGWWTD